MVGSYVVEVPYELTRNINAVNRNEGKRDRKEIDILDFVAFM